MLGAIIGEYIQATEGLGVFMVASESHFNVPRTWGIAVVIAAISGIGYGLTVLAQYLLVPWARRSSR